MRFPSILSSRQTVAGNRIDRIMKETKAGKILRSTERERGGEMGNKSRLHRYP